MPLHPHQTFNLILASALLALGAESVLLWKLGQKQPRVTLVSGSAAPATSIVPTQEPLFTAPGIAPSKSAENSIPRSIAPDFSAPLAAGSASKTAGTGQAVGAGKTAAPHDAAPVLSAQNALAKTYFEAATAALAKKDDKTALQNFRRVAQIAPENLPTRLNLALLYLGANQPAAAIPHLQKAVQLDPKSAAPRFQLAQAYLALKKPDLAIAPLETVVKILPKERAARALLAQVYSAQKRPRDAYNQWKSLAQSEPHDVEAHLQAASLAAGPLKIPTDAQKWLQRAQNAAPKDPRPALLLGRLFLSQNRPKLAAQALAGTVKSRPDVFDLYPLLADARLAVGDLPGARGALQSALSHLPKATNDAQKTQVAQVEGGLRLTLGRVLGQSKELSAAKQEFERAAALLPRNAEPRSLLALAALQSGDKKAAIAALQDALKLDSKRAADHLTLAQLFAQNGNWSGADAQYAAYIQLQPRDKLALTQWSQVAARRKNGEQGLQIWSKIAALDPKDPLPWLQSGAILRDMKRPAPALAAFERALAVRPRDASALFEVARLQSALKKPGAAQSWQNLIVVQPDYLPAYPALLAASARSGSESDARMFLARQLARGPENTRALSEILRFYEQNHRVPEARALLGDIIQRNPKAKTARAALDSFGVSPAPRTAPKSASKPNIPQPDAFKNDAPKAQSGAALPAPAPTVP